MDYTVQGPYEQQVKKSITILGLKNQNKTYSARGVIKYPVIEGQNIKAPIVVLLSGFLLTYSQYNYIAQRLTTWGFVTVQYDVSKIYLNTDSDQIAIFDGVLDYLKEQVNKISNYLDNISPDFNNIGIVGHSRGGKISTLLFTGNHSVKSIFPLDPVDQTIYTRDSPDYPSAIEALKGTDIPIGILGMGVQGQCNPIGNNSVSFYEASPADSFFFEILDSGHLQILEKFSPVVFFCNRGKNTDEVTHQLLLPPLIAWLRRTLYMDDDTNFEAFLKWADIKQSQQLIKYSFKGKKLMYLKLGLQEQLQMHNQSVVCS